MNGQFNKRLSAWLLTLFTPILIFAGTTALAADRHNCDTQDTYRVGAPGKGSVRNLDCERVEFSAFEQRSAKEQASSEERGIIKIGKPGYNRHPKND